MYGVAFWFASYSFWQKDHCSMQLFLHYAGSKRDTYQSHNHDDTPMAWWS